MTLTPQMMFLKLGIVLLIGCGNPEVAPNAEPDAATPASLPRISNPGFSNEGPIYADAGNPEPDPVVLDLDAGAEPDPDLPVVDAGSEEDEPEPLEEPEREPEPAEEPEPVRDFPCGGQSYESTCTCGAPTLCVDSVPTCDRSVVLPRTTDGNDTVQQVAGSFEWVPDQTGDTDFYSVHVDDTWTGSLEPSFRFEWDSLEGGAEVCVSHSSIDHLWCSEYSFGRYLDELSECCIQLDEWVVAYEFGVELDASELTTDSGDFLITVRNENPNSVPECAGYRLLYVF